MAQVQEEKHLEGFEHHAPEANYDKFIKKNKTLVADRVYIPPTANTLEADIYDPVFINNSNI